MKIGITGSTHFGKRSDIKDLLFKLKEKFDDDLQVITLGSRLGVDFIVKEETKTFNIDYKESPSYSNSWNIYCIGNRYKYGHRFSPGLYYSSIGGFVNYIDSCIIFNDDENNKTIKFLLKKLNSLNKKYILIDF